MQISLKLCKQRIDETLASKPSTAQLRQDVEACRTWGQLRALAEGKHLLQGWLRLISRKGEIDGQLTWQILNGNGVFALCH